MVADFQHKILRQTIILSSRLINNLIKLSKKSHVDDPKSNQTVMGELNLFLQQEKLYIQGTN